jgi:hypothetical protein
MDDPMEMRVLSRTPQFTKDLDACIDKCTKLYLNRCKGPPFDKFTNTFDAALSRGLEISNSMYHFLIYAPADADTNTKWLGKADSESRHSANCSIRAHIIMLLGCLYVDETRHGVGGDLVNPGSMRVLYLYTTLFLQVIRVQPNNLPKAFIRFNALLQDVAKPAKCPLISTLAPAELDEVLDTYAEMRADACRLLLERAVATGTTKIDDPDWILETYDLKDTFETVINDRIEQASIQE